MSKTIVLTQLKIAGMYVDIVNQKVIVNYALFDTTHKQWGPSFQEVYLVTFPETPTPSDQQLPAQYLQNLVDLYNAAKADLESRYLV
jgi:hypothetical protein